MNKYCLLAVALLAAGSASAQNVGGGRPAALGYYHDVAQFNRNVLWGSSRANALGGVNQSLGADPSSLLGNPAGLGVYRRSEVVGTATFFNANSTSSLSGQNTEDIGSRGNFNLANASIVFNDMKDDISAGTFRGGSFAIGWHRTNNFTNRYNYSGASPYNQNGSNIVDVYLNAAEGSSPAIFTTPNNQLSFNQVVAKQGFDGFVLDEFDGEITTYAPFIDVALENSVARTSGNTNQLDFSYGANIANKLFLGAGVGINFMRYTLTRENTERITDAFALDGQAGDIERSWVGATFDYGDETRLRGTGVHAKLGAIYRATEQIRFGLTYQTPTLLNVRENYETRLTTRLSGVLYPPIFDSNNQQLPPPSTTITDAAIAADFEYTIVMPQRISGGVSFFHDYGFVSADLEYVTNRNATMRDDRNVLSADNREIDRVYINTLNVRAGAEFALDMVRLRAGAQYLPSIYDERFIDPNLFYNAGDTWVFSGGAGLRFQAAYVDLAIMRLQYENNFDVHRYLPLVNAESRLWNVSLTVGGYF